jgi:hypothetical protein
MKATFHQHLYSGLTGGSSERREKCVPFRRDFRVRRKARDIDQPFRLGDRLLVERCDPLRERVDEAIEALYPSNRFAPFVRFTELDRGAKLGLYFGELIVLEACEERST